MPSAQLDSSSSPPSLLVVGADVLDGDFPVFQTIRRQLKSKLVNQAVAAKTLLAVESALGTDSRSPVAYFGLLVSKRRERERVQSMFPLKF